MKPADVASRLSLNSPSLQPNHPVAITSSDSPPRNHAHAPSSNHHPNNHSSASDNVPTPSSVHNTKTEPDCLPISDNNVSTTANDTLADNENDWDTDADINVSFVYTVKNSICI